MTTDYNITEELKRAYDEITPAQLEAELEGIELAPLSADAEQRIKNMVNNKINAQEDNFFGKTITKTAKWRIIAAAFVLVFAAAAVFSSGSVRAAVAKIFGFVPSVGVVEKNEETGDIFILGNAEKSAENDDIKLTLNHAFANKGKLVLGYTVYLSRISDADLDAYCNSLPELYRTLGYDKYFDIAEESPRLMPHTAATLGGREIIPESISVTETESLESARTVNISNVYDISDIDLSEVFEGVLNMGNLEIGFDMKKIEFSENAADAADGTLIEADGIKLLCVPTRKDNLLYLDYYACDLGEYKSTNGFRKWFNTDTLTVGGEMITDEIDESCIFFSEDSARVGNRLVYDLSGAEEEKAVIRAFGIFAEKEYSGKGVFLDSAPVAEQKVNQTADLDGTVITVSSITHRDYGEEDGYEEYGYGCVEFRYKAENTVPNREFIDFTKILINGEETDCFGISQYDLEYTSIIIPLKMPYEEMRSIEFAGAEFLLAEDIEIEISLK